MNVDIPTSLYRHFACDGSLLYVGISLSWLARTKAHSRSSRWFEQVAKVEIERFPSRAAALDAERDAIRSERPKFNVVHNRCSARVTGPGARKRLRPASRDPLFQVIRGPGAIVGPALVYKGETISVMIAHGEFGTAGELTEVVLGRLFPELPAWTDACASVLTIRRADEITLSEAKDTRSDIIKKLRQHLDEVEAFDSDLSLAVAFASRFPSAKSRRILDEVAVERGAAA